MISIVMAYYNRLPQLRHTLKSILRSAEQDYEVIIVDDFSDDLNNISLINSEFPSLDIKIIEMRKLLGKKYYCNPCVAYNTGFRYSRGDKIIIQNPECCHMGDVISYVKHNLTDSDYYTFHCWAMSKSDTDRLQQNLPTSIGKVEGKSRWYNHKTERPAALHFTSAITRKNLVDLNGFDERYSQGFNYDDNEFVERIKNKSLDIKFIEDPFVVHQYHRKSYGHPENPQPTVDNQQLYQETMSSKIIRADNRENICGI